MNKKLVQIARRYYSKCLREYNRVCTGMDIRGNKVPANKAESDKIKYIINFELEWIKDIYSFNAITRKDIDRAVKKYRMAKIF
jgi:hypothetical protein